MRICALSALFGCCCVAISSGTCYAQSQELLLSDITYSIVQRMGGDISAYQPVAGTTPQTIATTGSAGFLLSNGQEETLIVLVGGDQFCRLVVSGQSPSSLSAEQVAALADLLRPALFNVSCDGLLLIDSIGDPSLLLWTGPTEQGSSGLWISFRGAVPIHIVRRSDISPEVARVLASLVNLPESILTFADGRIAIISPEGESKIVLFDASGILATRSICIDAEPSSFLPHYRSSRVPGLSEIEELAYQSVHMRSRVDPLAYASCP
jgi:hypothetical protein